MPYTCDNHADRLAVMLATNLDNGDSMTACGECVFPLAVTIARAVLPEGRDLAVIDVEPEADAAADTPAPEVEAGVSAESWAEHQAAVEAHRKANDDLEGDGLAQAVSDALEAAVADERAAETAPTV